jgi:hypothetical protein
VDGVAETHGCHRGCHHGYRRGEFDLHFFTFFYFLFKNVFLSVSLFFCLFLSSCCLPLFIKFWGDVEGFGGLKRSRGGAADFLCEQGDHNDSRQD